MDIVKVQYRKKDGEYSPREYSYFSQVPLNVGDEIMVPVRDSMGAARVSAVGVPEIEIAEFADKLKIITACVPVEKTTQDYMPNDPLAE